MRRPPKPLSPARRRSRIVVWVAFAIVVTVRLLFPPERVERPTGPDFDFAPRDRFRRPPTRVHPPVSPVPPDLWRLHIEIAPADVGILRGYSWQGWRGERQERPEVLATVREGQMVYTNVALHLKGAAGSFRPFNDKPAMTLHFAKHAPGQQFHGYRQFSLNNSVQDPSYLSEAISRELFEAAGVPVPRALHATVLVNGRDLGLYVFTEGWGKPFLRRYFPDVSGNLYDGGFLRDITTDLDTNSGDNRSDRSDLNRLRAAVFEPDPALRTERLSEVLDIDRFITFVAMEIMTCHWDGYALNRNNYRLFSDAATGRMIFLPHGLDQMFGVMRSHPGTTIQPTMQGLVAQVVLATPEGRKAYLERIAELRSKVFLEEQLTNRVHELSRQLRPTLAAYGLDLAEQHDVHVANLCQRIVDRARSISEQLDSPPVPIAFDGRGVAHLSQWAPYSIRQRRGTVRFARVEREGRPVLQIAAGPGGGSGAWRARALLEAGVYRFEGRVQTRAAGPRDGVGLRIRGVRSSWIRLPDGEWTELSHRFAVPEGLAEFEFICEFQAIDGEAWFAEESLRLVRE